MILPDEEQFKRVKSHYGIKSTREEYLDSLKQQEEKSRELYHFVINEHPRTPWARRAQRELNTGFGMVFRDGFWDPNYSKLNIKFPKQ